jgi:site-specific DNA-methyltransferase (adenine-specific)
MNDKDFSEILKSLPKDLQCEIVANKQRKNYSLLEEAEIQNKLVNFFQKEFKRGRKSKVDKSKCQNVDTLKSAGIVRIDDLVGKLTGQSKETVRKNRIIYNAVKKKPGKLDSLVKKVDEGKASYTMLYKMAQRTEKRSPKPLPKGKFPVIYADPPWQYFLVQSGAAEDHYPTMSTEEICKLGPKIPAAEDAALFMWATIPKLDASMDVIKAWGFTYKSASVWVKEKDGEAQKNGMGYWINSAVEILLIAVKGAPGTPEIRIPGVVKAPRTKHSQKPYVYYEHIERAFPNRNYLELFARNPKPRPNWTYWGNEANKPP